MSELTDELDRENGPRYGAELDSAATILERLHPIGNIKGIGRLEVVTALREVGEIHLKMLGTLRSVHRDVCGSLCPSTWKSDEPQPHCDKCLAVKDAIEKALRQ